MPDPVFNDPALRALVFALDGLSMRQRATAHNIANVDTPGFKAQRVSFESQLRRAISDQGAQGLALQTTHQGHLGNAASGVKPAIHVEQPPYTHRNDGNSVDIDLEMTTLAETTLRYQALAQLAGMRLSLLKSAARDGR